MSQTTSEDRRSSVRVRSLLPCAVRRIDDGEIAKIEAKILDLAVLESDGVLHGVADWSERADELPREVVFVLNEIRALRQQISELQRQVAQDMSLDSRWVVINDRGVWVENVPGDDDLTVGAHVEVRLQIPSIHTPDVLAVGEVIRVEELEDDQSGTVVAFRSISRAHSDAIIRYALRRERQLARSTRFH